MTQARERRGSRQPLGRRRPSAKLVVILVLATAVVVFIVQNTTETRVRVLVPVVTMPLWLALFGSAAVSLLIGWLLARRR